MKSLLVLILFSLPIFAAPDERIQTRSQFVEIVSGRTLTRVGIRMKISSNGEVSGASFGERFTGTWIWEKGFYCDELIFENGQKSKISCDLVKVSSNKSTIYFYGNKGADGPVSMTIR